MAAPAPPSTWWWSTTETADSDLYQVPLAFYRDWQDRLDHAFIGHWDDPEFGPSHVYDAVHDRESMSLWLHAFAAGEKAVDADSPLTFHRLPGYDLDLEAHSTLFSGEQSNSSVAFGEDSLMKLFRRVTPGVNPDIQIHDVLTRAGSDHVAELYGWLDTHDEETDSVVQLAMLQQFLRTASDGFELAKASVRNLYAEGDLHADEVGGDFAGESSRLGTALAETHATLAKHFPTERLSADQVGDLAQAMRDRLEAAIDVVPAAREVRRRRCSPPSTRCPGSTTSRCNASTATCTSGRPCAPEGMEARRLRGRAGQAVGAPAATGLRVARRRRNAPLVRLRAPRRRAGRCRGDERGWRSVRIGAASGPNETATRSSTAYAGRDLGAEEQTLLAAYEADKAVYEPVYEARNRRLGWLSRWPPSNDWRSDDPTR